MRTTRIVNYGGVLQQALRDLAAWVEQGAARRPAPTYEVIDGQVFVPADASERKGVQPTVDVTANGRARADVAVGRGGALRRGRRGATRHRNGRVGRVGLRRLGRVRGELLVLDGSASLLNITAAHTFTEPGTYFPALLVRTQRHSDLRKPHARIQNLGRVRVVVV